MTFDSFAISEKINSFYSVRWKRLCLKNSEIFLRLLLNTKTYENRIYLKRNLSKIIKFHSSGEKNIMQLSLLRQNPA